MRFKVLFLLLIFSFTSVYGMEIKIRKSKSIYVIDIHGDMDLYNSYKLKDLVTKMIEKNVKKYIINLDKVEYIDSSGIGALVYVNSEINKNDCGLYITNINGNVKEEIETAKLWEYFPIVSTVEKALSLYNEESEL